MVTVYVSKRWTEKVEGVSGSYWVWGRFVGIGDDWGLSEPDMKFQAEKKRGQVPMVW